MLSRHFLRSKVLQMVYADKVDPNDILVVERNFKHYITSFNELGTTQLSSLFHFLEVAEVMMDEAKHKFIPTEADLNPNTRMLNNRLICRMRDNYDLRRQCEDAKVNWGGVEYDEMFRQAYSGLVRQPMYQEYLASKKSFKNDQEFALNLFKYLMNYAPLCESLYSESLFWEDDFDQIAQYNYKMLKSLDENFDESSPFYLMCDERDPSDREAYDFARMLLLTAIRHSDEVEAMIRKNLQGWEFDRVAEMDILLLNMAVAELTDCPSIPEKVTIDEYIELSKEFSSERSKLFINGILGKILLELRSQGRIKKSGRGLGLATKEEKKDETEIETPTATEEKEAPVVKVRKSRPRIKNG